MASFQLVVKPTAGGDKFSVDASPAMTIADLKEKVESKSQISPAEQRLIYKGQVLKDERTVDSYGLKHEHVLHMVRKPGQPSAPTQPAARAAGATAQSATATDQSLPDLSTLGLSGIPGLAPGNSPQQMQDYTSQMLNNPMLQSLMSNPDLLRSVLRSNPAVNDLMERNPEFAQLMNNPQLLRETLQASANPSLMREQMRNADRAMSNIESHPEGFNMLRRMYENIQEPLLNASTGSNAAENPFASLLGSLGGPNNPGQQQQPPSAAPPTSSTPNTAPLPNPWASSNPPRSTASPVAGLGEAGMPLPGGFGGMDLQRLTDLMQQPGMQQAMQGLMSSPGIMDSIAATNPQMRQMLDANPQLRDTLSNPQVMQQMMNPQNIQAMVQMQQAMQQLQSSGIMPGFGDLAGAGAGSRGQGEGANAAAPDLGSLMAMLGGGGGFGGGLGAPQPVANPEEAFATQLTQLEGMGFIDRAANVRALQTTGGDVNMAVERLLSGG